MFYIVCSVLYYIGMIFGAAVVLGIFLRAVNLFEYEFYTKKQINKANGVYGD